MPFPLYYRKLRLPKHPVDAPAFRSPASENRQSPPRAAAQGTDTARTGDTGAAEEAFNGPAMLPTGSFTALSLPLQKKFRHNF